jgi:hypothetical protein
LPRHKWKPAPGQAAKPRARSTLQGKAPALGAAAVLMLMFVGATLPTAPSLLQGSLHVESHAIGGAAVFELCAIATLVLVSTQGLAARTAMLSGLALLLPSLGLIVAALELHSLTILLTGAGVAAVALGYRGSLQLVNEIAPDNRRAELVSTYLMFCYAGVSLPVIGIGLVAVEETPDIANEAFAAVMTAFALLAIFVDLRRARR